MLMSKTKPESEAETEDKAKKNGCRAEKKNDENRAQIQFPSLRDNHASFHLFRISPFVASSLSSRFDFYLIFLFFFFPFRSFDRNSSIRTKLVRFIGQRCRRWISHLCRSRIKWFAQVSSACCGAPFSPTWNISKSHNWNRPNQMPSQSQPTNDISRLLLLRCSQLLAHRSSPPQPSFVILVAILSAHRCCVIVVNLTFENKHKYKE